MRTIMITGATSGFGLAIAHAFAANNWRLVLTGRRGERLQQIAAELHEKFENPVIPLVFDVRSYEASAAAIATLPANMVIDVLVNNAGLAAGLSSIEDGDITDWNNMIDTNIKGLLHVTRLVSPKMKAQHKGHIINIGSTAAKTVYRNGNVYSATKFAVDALSQSMRIDLLPYSIKVTAIHPGMAETEFSLVRFKGDSERAAKVYEDLQPLRGEDIADIVWYCANLPPHVCVNDLVVTCLNQANSTHTIRDSEKN